MTLFLLSSPIGCLTDVSERFLATIDHLQVLAVEDRRQSAKLLQLLQSKYPQYSLWPKKMINISLEKERQNTQEILSWLSQGVNVGLLTDAGTPSIADPGAYLINQVRRSHYSLEIIPGPSALVAALSLSGFEAELVIFVGFLPKKINQTLNLIATIKSQKTAKSVNLVFFESPLRIRKTAQTLFDHFSSSQLFLGRELTKKYQQLIWLSSQNFKSESLKTKGEYTGVLNIRMI